MKPLLPPEEKFWKRYSPHFELPLAGMVSLLAHGFVLGAMVLTGLGLLFQAQVEASKPPSMDVVMLHGDNGDGLEVGGGVAGGSGSEGPIERTEVVERKVPTAPPQIETSLPKPIAETTLPMLDPPSAESIEALAKLESIAREADVQVRKEMDLPEKKKATKPAPAVKAPSSPIKGIGRPGTGPGTNGLGNRGKGTGAGDQSGPGTGTGLPGGNRAATKQEVLAYRWRFDLAGGAKEHAEKLAAVGVTLAFPDPTGSFLVASDLTRRPVELRKDNLAAYKDAVKWYNSKPESVRELAQELRLPFVPRYVVLLLPKDREEKMAAEEARYAEQQRRNVKTVRATWFDFRLRDGQYEPTAIRQE